MGGNEEPTPRVQLGATSFVSQTVRPAQPFRKRIIPCGRSPSVRKLNQLFGKRLQPWRTVPERLQALTGFGSSLRFANRLANFPRSYQTVRKRFRGASSDRICFDGSPTA
ncbi:hypothetical protein MJO29_011668 [Puccinia striiformis f. sp. tritici]|nr:hypothetical protein MJO29_011668 [Puccinia striiformis f. sp. tritici]